jgi:hypothetical protein
MDELYTRIRARIAEIEAAREHKLAELNAHAELVLQPYTVAVAELRALLPKEPDAPAADPERG